ncbi:hypothetical protein JTE90_017927 [Oedothorax gibbosus]|uniref:Uncharacterized protein n=1 Tax=Oedothorax gibbosus TaxID=931172 RepID=A0AAV6TR02_9ARAC|nr:hypothetical protein JTE90_017927 [Oedothorax gibbosus]
MQDVIKNFSSATSQHKEVKVIPFLSIGFSGNAASTRAPVDPADARFVFKDTSVFCHQQQKNQVIPLSKHGVQCRMLAAGGRHRWSVVNAAPRAAGFDSAIKIVYFIDTSALLPLNSTKVKVYRCLAASWFSGNAACTRRPGSIRPMQDCFKRYQFAATLTQRSQSFSCLTSIGGSVVNARLPAGGPGRSRPMQES